MPNFKVFTQIPKPSKKGVNGTISVHNASIILFDPDSRIELEMQKPEIVHMNEYGIFFRGFQPDGCTKTGVPKYTYQEWWCVFA